MLPTTETQDAIAAADESLVNAFARRDAAGIAALYTEDGQILPSNSDPICGKKAIEGFWGAVLNMGIAAVELRTTESEDCGDAAVEVGSYGMQGADGQALDRGKYMVMWKREAGQWRLHRDIFNTSLPAPA